MTTAEKKLMKAEIAKLNATHSAYSYERYHPRFDKLENGRIDWMFSVFQKGVMNTFDTLLSDPTDIIEAAKKIGVGFYISVDSYVADEKFPNTKNKPYIRLF